MVVIRKGQRKALTSGRGLDLASARYCESNCIHLFDDREDVLSCVDIGRRTSAAIPGADRQIYAPARHHR